jgi:hypothetical protein
VQISTAKKAVRGIVSTKVFVIILPPCWALSLPVVLRAHIESGRMQIEAINRTIIQHSRKLKWILYEKSALFCKISFSLYRCIHIYVHWDTM